MSESQQQMAQTMIPSHGPNPPKKVGMETQVTACTTGGNTPEKINKTSAALPPVTWGGSNFKCVPYKVFFHILS